MKEKIEKIIKGIKIYRKKIVFGLMCVFYLFGWFSIVHPTQNTVNAEFLSDNTTVLVGMKKGDVVRYEMELSYDWLEEVRLRVSNVRQQLDGKLQIEIQPVNGDGEHQITEKNLSELDEQEDVVCKVEKDWTPGIYYIDIRAVDVPDEIPSAACFFQLRMSADSQSEADSIWYNGEKREAKKLKIAAGGKVKEKTYTFDFLMLAGFAFLVWALMDSEKKGKTENEVQ